MEGKMKKGERQVDIMLQKNHNKTKPKTDAMQECLFSHPQMKQASLSEPEYVPVVETKCVLEVIKSLRKN